MKMWKWAKKKVITNKITVQHTCTWKKKTYNEVKEKSILEKLEEKENKPSKMFFKDINEIST